MAPVPCRIEIAKDTWLRVLETADVDEIHALVEANREHLAAWMPWAGQDRSATEAHVAQTRERLAANDGFEAAVVEGGAIVGVTGYHGVDWTNRATSIGYWLSAGAQGRGLMSAAVRALTDHAIGGWRLNRVTIEAAVGNVRSRAIPDRLGYREEAVLRQSELVGGRYLDGVLYAMLAEDWPRSEPEATGSA